jgi:gamma-glutamylcyclotransferase (GGCT)/AIG2-like uncharacterized protein YtfP
VFPDFLLSITRKNMAGNGTADMVERTGRLVWGVVYDIPDSQVTSLNDAEGFKPSRLSNSYYPKTITVFVEGDETKPMKAVTYFATKQPNPPLPSKQYLGYIINGAKYWNLPEHYVLWLSQFATSS